MSHHCILDSYAGAAVLVVGAALVADACLPLSHHETLSTHAGRHPWWTLAALGVAGAHFNWHRLSHFWGIGRWV